MCILYYSTKTFLARWARSGVWLAREGTCVWSFPPLQTREGGERSSALVPFNSGADPCSQGPRPVLPGDRAEPPRAEEGRESRLAAGERPSPFKIQTSPRVRGRAGVFLQRPRGSPADRGHATVSLLANIDFADCLPRRRGGWSRHTSSRGARGHRGPHTAQASS